MISVNFTHQAQGRVFNRFVQGSYLRIRIPEGLRPRKNLK